MKTTLVVIALLSIVAASTARAQSTLGPPLPQEAPVVSPPPVELFDPSSPLTTLNPLRVLESVGNALPGGRPSDDPGADRSAPRGGLSTALNIMVVLTVVSLVPSIMLMTTCFVRILVVLGLLKQALGTASVPPPQVITALALFMTLLVMAPTLERINTEAIAPYRAGQIDDYEDLWNRAKAPVRDFMFDQIEATGNWSSVYMILQFRGVDTSAPEGLTRADVDMISLIPAYMLSELKVAFLMGFRVYLPFLVIDMVISTMLISMSMMMLPPVLVSLPFKILLFVLVDGWTLVVGGLMASFARPGVPPLPDPATVSLVGGAWPALHAVARPALAAAGLA